LLGFGIAAVTHLLSRLVWPLGRLLAALGLCLGLWLGVPARAQALEMRISEVTIAPCPLQDVGSQPEQRRPSGASCYALRGQVSNNSSRTMRDTDVFALILDANLCFPIEPGLGPLAIFPQASRLLRSGWLCRRARQALSASAAPRLGASIRR